MEPKRREAQVRFGEPSGHTGEAFARNDLASRFVGLILRVIPGANTFSACSIGIVGAPGYVLWRPPPPAASAPRAARAAAVRELGQVRPFCQPCQLWRHVSMYVVTSRGFIRAKGGTFSAEACATRDRSGAGRQASSRTCCAASRDRICGRRSTGSPARLLRRSRSRRRPFESDQRGILMLVSHRTLRISPIASKRSVLVLNGHQPSGSVAALTRICQCPRPAHEWARPEDQACRK
jgi:hypothetical protein